MYTTLLFQESPFIGMILIIICFITVIYKYYSVFSILLLILIISMTFYRYKPHNKRYDNNIIISPANGTISYAEQKDDNMINISIYLNFLNNHTQIYPVNGIVTERIYDKNGKFELANNINKSRYNEKKIHIIKMENNNNVKVSQIAGFFVRRIVSSKNVPEKVMAGEYLGMIKFGSRVDLIFMGDINKLLVTLDNNIKIGDVIYKY